VILDHKLPPANINALLPTIFVLFQLKLPISSGSEIQDGSPISESSDESYGGVNYPAGQMNYDYYYPTYEQPPPLIVEQQVRGVILSL